MRQVVVELSFVGDGAIAVDDGAVSRLLAVVVLSSVD